MNFWQRWGTRGNQIYANARARVAALDITVMTTGVTRSVSDHLPDTEYVAKPYCPRCEPDRDPLVEILDTRYCSGHDPERKGEDDYRVTSQAYLSGSQEAGGTENAAWSNLVHRGRVVSLETSEKVGTGGETPVQPEFYC